MDPLRKDMEEKKRIQAEKRRAAREKRAAEKEAEERKELDEFKARRKSKEGDRLLALNALGEAWIRCKEDTCASLAEMGRVIMQADSSMQKILLQDKDMEFLARN